MIMPLGFIQFAFALFVDIAFAVAVSYGAALVAQAFAKKPRPAAGKIANLPIQHSQKGIAIPKVYGCERVSGNIIWLGTQNWYEKRTRQPHVKEKVRVGTYYRSFLIGIAEGSGSITKIWMGKRLLWSSTGGSTGNTDSNEQVRVFGPAPTTDPGTSPANGTILLSNGDGTQDARWFTGEDFGNYDDLIWCYFEGFENLPGTGSAIPNFTFEISNSDLRWTTTYITQGDEFDLLDADFALSNTITDPGSGCGSIDINQVNSEIATNDSFGVWRYQSDDTIDNTHYVPDGGWPGNMDTVLCGVRYTHGGDFLYVGISLITASNHMVLYKFNVTTGDEIWNFVDTFAGSGISVDSSDNCYVRSGTGVNLTQIQPDGTAGTAYGSAPWEFLSRDIWSDEDNNILLVSGKIDAGAVTGAAKLISYNLTTGATNWIYKQIGADRTAGEVWGVKTKDEFIYCAGDSNAIHVSGDATATVWKFDLQGNIVARYDSGGNAGYLWFDYLGRLIVKEDTNDELHILDPSDLSLIKIVSYSVKPISAGQEGINLPIASGANFCHDINPALIIHDLATNDRYGAGISEDDYINMDSITEETAYWDSENNQISLSLTDQMPMMDWVDFILSHCNGFRFWSVGRLNIGAFKDEASVASLNQDDFIREEGDNPPPPVNIVKRKKSETFNRVEISWTDRQNTYDLAVAKQEDEVDQRVSGKVRPNSIDLTGIHNPTLAQKMALRYIFESMYRFSIYSFSVGYKRMLLTVGDVIDITDGHLLTSERCRIISREEDKDGRQIAIEAVEDTAGLYPSVDYVTQQTLAEAEVHVSADDLVTGTLTFREHLTSPNLYISFAPGDSDTDGADLYRSTDNINYEFIGRTSFDFDNIRNVAGALTSSLPRAKAVMHRYSEFFTADIGTAVSPQTNITDDDFFNNRNLARIGDEFISWKTAEDQGSGVWKFTQLIRGMFGSEAIEHPVGTQFGTLSPIDFYYTFTEEVAGQTLFFKALATHMEFVGQSLSDVAETAYVVVTEHLRPAPLSGQTIKNQQGLCTVSNFPVTISFNLASREAGYNLGGKGEGGWGAFTKDDRIVGINVTLKTIGGTQIAFEYHDLDGYHADDYELVITEADRLGNDPVLVELEPVIALPSSKATANTIDLVP